MRANREEEKTEERERERERTDLGGGSIAMGRESRARDAKVPGRHVMMR